MAGDFSVTNASETSAADTLVDGGPIPLTETTVTAFIGRTQRGPVNRAVRVTSFDEYRKVFGSHTPFSFLSYAVLHYFLAGGEVAVVVRVINRGVRSSLRLGAGEGELRLQARNPGSHELIRASVDYDHIDLHSPRFNLALQRVARGGSSVVEDQEIYRNLSIDAGDEKYLVDAMGASKLVTVAGPVPTTRPDATRAKNPGEPIPYIRMDTDGSDGEELTDYDLIGSNEEATGLFALDGLQRVNFLCVPLAPGQQALGITALVAAERYCRKLRAMLIVDPPWNWRSPESALLGIRTMGFSSDNAMVYFPRVRSRESWQRWPDGLPACGAIAGALAERDRQAGVGSRSDPGAVVLKGGLAAQSELSPTQCRMLVRHGINVLGRANSSTALLGDVTLAGQRCLIGAWRRLKHRRLALFVINALERHTRWVIESEAPEVLQALNDQIRTFLTGLADRGALASATPAQAFFLRCELSTSHGVLITIGLALTKPGEFEVFEISHNRAGSITRASHSFEPGIGAA